MPNFVSAVPLFSSREAADPEPRTASGSTNPPPLSSELHREHCRSRRGRVACSAEPPMSSAAEADPEPKDVVLETLRAVREAMDVVRETLSGIPEDSDAVSGHKEPGPDDGAAVSPAKEKARLPSRVRSHPSGERERLAVGSTLDEEGELSTAEACEEIRLPSENLGYVRKCNAEALLTKRVLIETRRLSEKVKDGEIALLRARNEEQRERIKELEDRIRELEALLACVRRMVPRFDRGSRPPGESEVQQ